MPGVRSITSGHPGPHCDLRSLMVTAQAGDSQAYRQLLAIIVIRSMEACAPAISRQELDAADVDEFVGRVLQMVHAALATFDPRHSIDIWLLAIISMQLEQCKRQHRAGLQATGARATASWYRRLLKQI